MKNYSLEKAAQDNPTFKPDSTSYENGKTVNNDIAWKEKEAAEEGDHGEGEKGKKEGKEEAKVEDPWKVNTLKQNYVPWHELNDNEKIIRVILYPVKVILVLGFLYLFICSLDFLSSAFKLLGVLGFLYLFICSLDFLTSAFKLLGGKKAGEVFQQSEILANPVAGLMMGVLVTVLVQSSSTSTSIVISMVGAGILTPKTAVPIVMGANIGTSVTNTIVALGQITNKEDFRRAFAGATVHDMFNWMAVLVLLPLEIVSGYLFRLSDALVGSMHLNETLDVNQDLLKVITKPFTTLIIQVSSSGIKKIATGEVTAKDATLLKLCCDKVKPASCCDKELKKLAGDKLLYGAVKNYTEAQRTDVCQEVDQCVLKDYDTDLEGLKVCVSSQSWERANVTASYDTLNSLRCGQLAGNTTATDCCNDLLKNSAFYSDFSRNVTSNEKMSLCNSVNATCFSNNVYDACVKAWHYGRVDEGVGDELNCKDWTKAANSTCNKPCKFLFRDAFEKEGGPLSEEAIGGILLVIALVLLCVCLVCIVKLLHSLLQGPMAKMIKKFVNADFPGYCAYFTGYIAILIGAGMTILVQSSSIFTSTLTPLVGMGVINLERMYPLTLGSNIGTTATGILAALAQDTESIPRSLQVAFCHLFFNISGILIFYPLPFFRPSIPAAKFLGNTTAKYRWFAIVYLLCMFFLLPLTIFGLSIPGWYVLAIVLIPIALLAITISIIKCLQAKRPERLPAKLQNWKFLPKALRSLEPYDRRMKKLCFCNRFQDIHEEGEEQTEKTGVSNDGFDGVVTTNM
ncbi:hypothetical protein ACOMHN_003289 [Nucella lapillus]